VSSLIQTAARPNRKARLAQRSLLGRPVPGMQQRPQGIPAASGAAVGMGPIGPMLVVQLGDGQGIPMPMTPDQARQTGVALISVAAQYEILKKMEADGQADNQSVPTNPDLEAILADAQTKTGGPTDLKGDDEGDVDDDCDLSANPEFPVIYAGLPEPAPNTFDINGKPVYQAPSQGE
jgi:hypothetical protein